MRKLLLFLVFVLFCINPIEALEICPLMMHSVYKIEGKGKGNIPNIGTCFFISKNVGYNKSQSILVTAKHVLRSMTGDEITIYLRSVKGNQLYLSPNVIPIRLNKQPLWREYQEVAAMKIELPKNTSVKMLSTDFLATNKLLKKYSITTGVKSFVVGFPYGVGFGKSQFPMLRSGVLSSFPINDREEFLVDFEVFQGYSGSPVITNYKGAALILGMITDEVFLEEVRPNKKTHKMRGLGLGKAIPASFIKKLIDAI